jgi:hypothetical protein
MERHSNGKWSVYIFSVFLVEENTVRPHFMRIWNSVINKKINKISLYAQSLK